MKKGCRKSITGKAGRRMLQLERLEPRILLSGVSAYALQTLASFNGTTGSSPVSGLIMDGEVLLR